MQDGLDNELDSFRKEIADDLGYRRKSGASQRLRSPFPFKLKTNVLIVGGAGILLLLIILVAAFSGNNKKPAADDLGAIQSRLNQLEKRIKHLEGMEGKLIETARTEGSLSQQLQNLSTRVELVEKRITVDHAEAKAPVATQEKPFPLKKGRYHKVRSGDTLFRIAAKYGITIDELCRLNNINPKHVIYPGQSLLVASESKQ
jgi:LysM repeat protein